MINEWYEVSRESLGKKNNNIHFINCLLYTSFQGANFEQADFAEAKLEGAYLIDVHLQGANLQEVNFEKANLQGANFQGAKPVSYTHLDVYKRQI